MANLLNMRLCGGTFLVLLFEARGQRRASRMSEGRPADGTDRRPLRRGDQDPCGLRRRLRPGNRQADRDRLCHRHQRRHRLFSLAPFISI